mmetsp:Transcript_676/g.860  ORF Transcript_676/g.860 Transcript_676/m.860 type:complete len:263 (+) Transcript_676:36-824(+)
MAYGAIDDEERLVNGEIGKGQRARGLFIALGLLSFGIVFGVVVNTTQQQQISKGETQLEALIKDPNNPTNISFNDITCDNYDDDSNYPSMTPPGIEPKGNTDCGVQDSGAWCSDCQSNTICTKYCGNAESLCAHNPNGAFQYVNPCLWQMIADLPKVCADHFTSVPPLTSRNIGQTLSVHSEPEWYCDIHSMCQSCLEDDADGTSSLNKYCQAVISYYDFRTNLPRDFLRDLADDAGGSYWCQSETLQSIEDGTFSDTFFSS